MRETAIRGRFDVRCRYDGRLAGVEGLPQRRLGDGPGDEVATVDGTGPQRDVHCPVVAGRLGELAGAVERVDDPDSVGRQPGLVVLALLGKDCVTRTMLGDQPHQQVVGRAVSGVLELLALETLGADLEQALTGDGGGPGCEDMVVGGGLGGRSPWVGIGHGQSLSRGRPPSRRRV